MPVIIRYVLEKGEKGVSMQVADAFATVARKSDWGSEGKGSLQHHRLVMTARVDP